MKGVHYVRYWRRDHLPRWYVYAWRGGPLIGKFDQRRKPQLQRRELDRIFAELDKKAAPAPTLFRSLIREWRSCDPSRPSSPEWSALAAGTKRT